MAVNVVTAVGMRAAHETLYYKCMGHGYSDVQVFAELVPGCMPRWVSVWRKFLIASWNMLQRRSLSTRQVCTMILNETDAWDPRWVRMLAEFVDESLGVQTTARQRVCLREWSTHMILQYERSLIRLCTDSVFVNEPLNVLRLVQHAHVWTM